MTPMTLLIGSALLTGALSAYGPPSSAIGPKGEIRLSLPRQLRANEMLVVRLKVGVVPRGTKIIVRTADHKVAGTIDPFGIRPGQKAGVYTVSVPAKAVADEKVSLQVEVLEKDAKAARPPTRSEIEDAELSFVPVSSNAN
jgi:hypothetical protein